jgi:hypothetical protein
VTVHNSHHAEYCQCTSTGHRDPRRFSRSRFGALPLHSSTLRELSPRAGTHRSAPRIFALRRRQSMLPSENAKSNRARTPSRTQKLGGAENFFFSLVTPWNPTKPPKKSLEIPRKSLAIPRKSLAIARQSSASMISTPSSRALPGRRSRRRGSPRKRAPLDRGRGDGALDPRRRLARRAPLEENGRRRPIRFEVAPPPTPPPPPATASPPRARRSAA